jgi:hypothetical protein
MSPSQVNFGDNLELDLKSVATSSSSYRLKGFTASTDYCTLSFSEMSGFRTSVSTGAAVMTSGDGSTSSAGMFTDGTDVYLANGDGTVQQLQGEGDRWHSECALRVSTDATVGAFERRTTAFQIDEKESREICAVAPSYDPTDPAQVGLASDGVAVWFINADHTKNMVGSPTEGCLDRATRGLDVTAFPNRKTGFTLGKVDSARACSSASYDARVVVRFPNFGGWVPPLEMVQLGV